MKRELPPGGPGGDPGREVREELEFYLAERRRELERSGMDPEEARRVAARAFGDVERIEAEVRRIRRGRRREHGRRRMIGSLVQDVRLALRGVRSRPGFSAVVVATLALGIGAVTAIFSVANASLLRALPFEEAERLVFVQGAYDAPEGPAIRGASVPEARDWESMSRSFSEMAPVDAQALNLTGDGSAERLLAEQVGEGFFELLRVTPLQGRLFSVEEFAVPGDRQVALLSEGLWVRRFASDPRIVGRSVELNGAPFTVVGVLPATFPGTSLQADLWIPLGNPVTGADTETAEDRGSRWLSVVARLADGVTLEAAARDMEAVATRLEEAHPRANEDRIALVTPMRDVYLGNAGTLVLVVLGAAGLLLVIAGANVANLLLVRTTGRAGEVLMRKALGAGQGRLVAQFVTESLVLSALGAAIGLAVGVWGAEALASAMPAALLPSYVDVRPDLLVFLVTAGLMGLVGVLAGLAPALLAARKDLASGLRDAAGGPGRSSGLQSALVVGEVALALLLLVGAGLMTRSFGEQMAVRPGFDHERLYAFRVTFPAESYPADALRSGLQELERTLEATPGVDAATFASDAPLRGGYSASYIFTEGSSDEDRIRFYLHRVAPDWMETLGTEVVRGRSLEISDLDNPEVTVISRALAERFFPGQDPVGQNLRIGAPDGLALRIVGVAEDVRYRDLTSDLLSGADDPDIYVPWDRFLSRRVDVVLRTDVDPATVESRVREAVRSFDPDLPVYQAQPMSVGLDAQTAQARFGTVLLLAFSGLAVTLAVIGLYGVLSFSVDRRGPEIAVRVAMGAEGARVRRMVVFQGMRLASVGLVLGLLGSLIGAKSLETFLFGVEPVDPWTYAAVTALMAFVALMAAWLPALRATRVDPADALRSN